MRIIPPSAFAAMPWKNGGGITREILKEERGGRLLWRLSIAEVASDGPFSLFPGLSRILTVIEGKGLVLTAPNRELRALPLIPLAFSGDWPIVGKRIGGDVRDFNVIFDASAVDAEVTVHNPLRIAGRDDAAHFILALGEAEVHGEAIAPHSLVALEKAEVEIAGSCLLVTLRLR